ncbi:MAG: hypothetical protein ACLRM9_00485 [Collinsella aerofaciens]
MVRCSTYEEFMALVDEIERDVACEAALAAGESVPPHPLEAGGGRYRAVRACRFAPKVPVLRL